MIRRPTSRTCRCADPASGRPRPAASSGQVSGATRSVARPATAWSTSRTSSSASRLGSRSAWETSTSQVATSARSTVASRRPPTDSLRSGTDACASSPVRSPRRSTSSRSAGQLARARRGASARAGPARSRRVRDGSPARWRASRSPSATRGSSRAVSRDLRHRPHRVVDVRPRVPQRVPDLLRDPAYVDLVGVHEDHVQVAVRRQLRAAVPADRDQGDPGVVGAVERLREGGGAELVRLRGAASTFGLGHRVSLRALPRPRPRCAPARRSRPAAPRPCRRRSCRCGRS